MNAAPGNIIWQYWETRGHKPAFIDGFHEIARRNSGVRIELVTPETLSAFLPDIEEEIPRIEDLAHKADMIRTRLVERYGGMWLDSDAVVLRDLNWLFDHLKDHEFVGFNNEGRLGEERPWVRVCCFLSRPGGRIVGEWVLRQRSRLPRTVYGWSEIGAQMLNAVCLENSQLVKILPFEDICPIGPKKVHEFAVQDDRRAGRILDNCFMVMVSNRSLETRSPELKNMSAAEIASGETVLSRIVQKALRARPVGGGLAQVETIHGPMLAFEDDFITKQIVRFGTHTRPEIAFLASMVEPGDAVFDLGAHIGTYAIPLARKAGATGKLLAVEGKRETFQVLQKNLAGAGLEAETIALNALIARAGLRYAAETPKANTGGTIFVPVEEGGVETEAVSIDELARRHFVPRVIKIDIEGGEASALADCALLRQERPILYAEVNAKLLARQGASIAELDALFGECGYRLFHNAGMRHAANDEFAVAELERLPVDRNNLDVLAVHKDDPRLDRLAAAT